MSDQNIDWDAHLDGPDAPWRQDEDLFDCTECGCERGDLDEGVSHRWGRDVCSDCTSKSAKATTWTRMPPTDDGWYWVRYPASGIIQSGSIFPAYVRNGAIFDDSRIARRLGIAVEIWPFGLEEPNESKSVSEAENTEARR